MTQRFESARLNYYEGVDGDQDFTAYVQGLVATHVQERTQALGKPKKDGTVREGVQYFCEPVELATIGLHHIAGLLYQQQAVVGFDGTVTKRTRPLISMLAPDGRTSAVFQAHSSDLYTVSVDGKNRGVSIMDAEQLIGELQYAERTPGIVPPAEG